MTRPDDDGTNDVTRPPPPVLNYGKPTAGRRVASVVGQGLLGFGTWLVTLAAMYGVGTAATGVTGTALFVAISLPVVAAVGLGLWLRVRHGWRGFLPGLLLGFGLTCLVPVGIVAVACGGGLKLGR